MEDKELCCFDLRPVSILVVQYAWKWLFKDVPILIDRLEFWKPHWWTLTKKWNMQLKIEIAWVVLFQMAGIYLSIRMMSYELVCFWQYFEGNRIFFSYAITSDWTRFCCDLWCILLRSRAWFVFIYIYISKTPPNYCFQKVEGINAN